ncbi:MAG: DEAD/DEAH box helicase family protein [Candidatus Beckwithbacteria bacterium]
MSNLTRLIQLKTEYYINEEKKKSNSVVGNLAKYIEASKLRQPQIEAIKVYLWLKFVGNNQKLATIIKKGLLYDDEQAKTYDNYFTFGENYITQFLNQFAQDNNLKKLSKKLVNDPKGQKIKWENVLEDLLHHYDYPNYLFSLPMGAGKTFLMAAFIYLDLYFSKLFNNDKRFAKNFVIFAPQATKTAILPSLQTIKNFNPEWVLPKPEADRIKQIIQIEILDALSSKRKDKLQGNNPNLEKVNRVTQTKDYGLVFITNAEKVVLERYSDKDKLLIDPNSLLYDQKKASEIVKYNDLRDKLSKIPFLGVILDEVHHTYGKSTNGEKKLRTAVGILNQHKNVVGVIGMSGTPFVKNSVKVEDDEIKLNQIQDIVYNYYLNQGIGKFLKIPDVRKREVKENVFIKEALTEFFKDFDITYFNGTKSKIVFYCPSIKKLNEDILPVIQEWYQKNRPNKHDEIFKYYTTSGKKDKDYVLPKDSLAIFHNLDKPYSDKRVVLLVAVGTEGWDCKSLTAVVLPRKETTKNFVLQTTCRCLREVENAGKEKALIFLGDGNYEKLESQLKENYHLTIADLKGEVDESIQVRIKKPRLGKLKYKQVFTKYNKIIRKITKDPKETLSQFNLSSVKSQHAYSSELTKAKIGKDSLTHEVKAEKQASGEFGYSFNDFLYDLAKSSFGKYSESELLNNFSQELKDIFQQIEESKTWFIGNPNFEVCQIAKTLSASLMEEVEYRAETIGKDVEIEFLEWEISNPNISLMTSSGLLYKFMPRINSQMEAKLYQRHPEDLDPEAEKIDPQNISFNYLPYRMDSDFERVALEDMLKMSELAGLEVYFNGYKDGQLQSFWVQTPEGKYTPDFLIIKRSGKNIAKVLILETKAKSFYDDEFKRKEKFMKEVFIKHNPNFSYECFVDESGNNFERHKSKLREMIESM